MSKIEVKNVFKIFGTNPDSVLPMVKEGASKEEVLEKTGHTVGLDNVSLSIEEGETFVCMGLSGSGKSTLIRHLNRLIDPTDGDIIVDGTNVSKAKPDPEVFLRAAELLSTKPQDCIVFEDSLAGIQAANMAKMTSIGIGDKTILSEADFVFQDFTKISVEFIKELMEIKEQQTLQIN